MQRIYIALVFLHKSNNNQITYKSFMYVTHMKLKESLFFYQITLGN